MHKSLLSLSNSALAGTFAATSPSTMSRIQAICPISMRPAYFGSRRIAPVAETSRSNGRGARPTVEELRPAQNNRGNATDETCVPEPVRVSAFVTQVIAQFEPASGSPAAKAASRYEAADELDRWRTRWASKAV